MRCSARWMWVAAVVMGWAAGLASGGEARARAGMPWDLESLSRVPAVYPAPGIEAAGVKGMFFEGLAWKKKPTRVFAWYGAPAAKAGEKLPAMVLVHGGGGTAFAEWVRLWNGRGYAAIAMDTCGAIPVGSYGKWKRHEAGGPGGWGGFEQIDEPVEDQWPYHAVADVVLAHSLIRSFPEVDAKRVGVTGISWGGYLTSIVAGVDGRFALAVPVYGCGFLGENSCWVGTFEKMGAKGQKWLGMWDPSQYLGRAMMPMLWVTGTNDFAYPMDSLQKSYRLARGPRALAVRIRMAHAHGGPGENPEEIRAFADHLLKGSASMARVTGQGRTGGEAWVRYEGGAVARAELAYTRDRGAWQERKWEAAAVVDGKAGQATAAIPAGTSVYYINLFDAAGRVVSGEHEVLMGGAAEVDGRRLP